MNETKPPTAEEIAELVERLRLTGTHVIYGCLNCEAADMIKALTQQNQQAIASNRAKDERIEKLDYIAVEALHTLANAAFIEKHVAQHKELYEKYAALVKADDDAQRKGAKA